MDALPPIEWRLHLRSSPEEAFSMWTTDAGRERFWAETSRPHENGFTLGFINGQSLDVRVIEAVPASRFGFRYFGGSTVTVSFEADGGGGCDLLLVEKDPEAWVENHAGWVAVLLALKAATDFAVDLRSHDQRRTWDCNYID